MFRKLALCFSVVALVGSAVFVSGSAQAGPPPIDNSNATVTCNTILKGLIVPKPPLTLAGTAPEVITVKGLLGDCVSSDPSITFLEGKSSFVGTISGGTNGCTGLAGPSPSTGTITIKWKTVQPLSNPVSTVTIPAGGSFGNFAAVGTSTYGQFDLGAPTGTALSVTGGFTGGTGGAASHTTVFTTQSVGSILGACGSVAGLKAINIGIGQVKVG